MTKVSVLMAVYNGARHLPRSLDSIFGQTLEDFEFIVVDDGSTDETPAILEGVMEPRLVVIRNEENLGLTVSLNKGLKAAKGDFVARMDADDEAMAERLGKQLETVERENADICFCRAVIADEQTGEERRWQEMSWPLVRWRGLFDNVYGMHSAAMFRRSAIVDAGGYDEGFRRAQDYDLWDRCLAGGLTMAFTPNDLLRYRSHGDSLSVRDRGEQMAAARTVSLRALRRSFSGASDEELAGLRWLMYEQPDSFPGTPQVLEALQNCVERVASHLDGVDPTTAAPVWNDVAGQLTRRFKHLGSSLRSEAFTPVFKAGLKSRSFKSLALIGFGALFPNRV